MSDCTCAMDADHAAGTGLCENCLVEWQQSRIATLEAEVEQMEACIASQGRDHESGDCQMGSLCPWCEIERLREAYGHLEKDRDAAVSIQDDLRTKLADTRSVRDTAIADVTTEREHNRKAFEKITGMQAEVDRLKQERDHWDAECSAELVRLRGIVDAFRSENIAEAVSNDTSMASDGENLTRHRNDRQQAISEYRQTVLESARQHAPQQAKERECEPQGQWRDTNHLDGPFPEPTP